LLYFLRIGFLKQREKGLLPITPTKTSK